MPSKKHKGGNQKKARQGQWVQQNLPAKGVGGGGGGSSGDGSGSGGARQPAAQATPKLQSKSQPKPQPAAQDLQWTPLKTTLVAGDAFGAQHLNATALGGAVPVYTDDKGTVLTPGSVASAGVLTISASTAATPTHAASAAAVARTFTVLAKQVITWQPGSTDLVFGDALGAQRLNATALGGAVLVYKNADNKVLAANIRPPVGTHVISVTCEATPTHAAPAQPTVVTLKVAKAESQITWATPATAQRSGNPARFVLGDTQLNAVRVKGEAALVYMPPKGTVLAPGTHFLRAVHPASASFKRSEAAVRLVVHITAEARNGFEKMRKGEGFKAGKGLSVAEKKRWDDDEGGVKTKGQQLMQKMQRMTLDEMVDLMDREVPDAADRNNQGGTYPNKMYKFANGLQVRIKPNGDAHGSAPKFCIEIVDDSVCAANRFTVQGEQNLIKAKLSVDGNPAPTGPGDTDLAGVGNTTQYTTGACAATHPSCRAKLVPKLAWDKPPALEAGKPLEAGVHLKARIVDEEGEGSFVYDPKAGDSAPRAGSFPINAVLPASKRYVEGSISVDITIVAKPHPTVKDTPAMDHDIDALLQREELSIRPADGSHDQAAVQAHLLALDGCWNDPQRSHVFLLFLDAGERAAFLQTHVPSTATEYSYPIVPVVELRPDQIYVNLFAGDTHAPVTRPLLEWLLARQPCTVD